ncbi:ABC transporter ATP-binding protein [Allorhizobium sp. BGMRC 0089]|uniref:ABC transporter ATP-binding protein n=1 Tax=Allorhizobium sonneratiae TaxID=2934936 RepID=UPI0020347E11|nr:ABC transporter ATP-binding protein [Allorhizobium sonneratiae]MCM2293087.1 ABC transporter ATP-binding protein [Allorhizobium sonneratiae]
MDAPQKPLLEVSHLSVEFPVHKQVIAAVKDVSFSVYPGETLCVLGESGSGKSVTARAILKLLAEPGKITSGRILLAGENGRPEIDITAAGNRQMQALRGSRIAMIFQEPMTSLSPVHKIGDQIVEAILLHENLDPAAARKRTIDLLRQVRIPDPEQAIDRYPFEYSGGMRQRAMIAMALSCNPHLLIADEPTTALDVTTQAEILDLIVTLQRERGMAVLFITHDIGVVAEIADRVMVMYRGEKVEEGPVEQVLRRPAAPYTAALLGAVMKLETPLPRRSLPQETPALVEIDSLGLTFGGKSLWGGRKSFGVKAIDGIDLTLKTGETLGIVGESGSGKTTLGRALLKIHDPTQGQIRYRSGQQGLVDIASASRKTMRGLYADMRMVFQDPHSSLNPRLTVFETIAEPLRMLNLSADEMRRKVHYLLDRVGLPANAANRYPHAFSGGQRQRIAIARAIAPNPRLIVADEPTSALDVSLRHQVLDLLAEVRAEFGISFIFISHDMTVIRYFCDRVAVMQKGRVVEIGEVDQICLNPQHPYTQSLIASVPQPDLSRRRKPLTGALNP